MRALGARQVIVQVFQTVIVANQGLYGVQRNVDFDARIQDAVRVEDMLDLLK